MIKILELTGKTCMPCKMLSKALHAYIADKPQFELIEKDATEQTEYKVMSTPYLVITKDDEKIYEGHPNSPSEILSFIKTL